MAKFVRQRASVPLLAFPHQRPGQQCSSAAPLAFLAPEIQTRLYENIIGIKSEKVNCLFKQIPQKALTCLNKCAIT